MDIENGRIVPGAINDKCVCSEHFSDTALQEIVKQEGHRGKCSYCGERRIVMDMPDFVKMVKEKLESDTYSGRYPVSFHWQHTFIRRNFSVT